MKNLLLILMGLMLTVATKASAADNIVESIENAHKKQEFLLKEAVSFDLDITFGGNKAFEGKITTLTDSTKILMETDNGITLIYDGTNVYQTPADKEYERARFDIFTWSYFFLFPYKLNDPGTVWKDYGIKNLDGKDFKSGKLSFEKGIGDSPDDWYVVYADPESDIIRYSAYIVTYFESQDKAEKDPHAIEYSDYVDVNGIPISTEWKFRGWKKDEGLTKELGHAKVSNVEFIEVEPDLFKKPENAKLVEK